MTPLQEVALLLGAIATILTAIGTWARVVFDARRDERERWRDREGRRPGPPGPEPSKRR
jgi:hypothetical protein